MESSEDTVDLGSWFTFAVGACYRITQQSSLSSKRWLYYHHNAVTNVAVCALNQLIMDWMHEKNNCWTLNKHFYPVATTKTKIIARSKYRDRNPMNGRGVVKYDIRNVLEDTFFYLMNYTQSVDYRGPPNGRRPTVLLLS